MDILGTWYNELGSQMELHASGSQLSGTYMTAVGEASGTYELTGRYEPKGSMGSHSLGWVVAWENSNSVTAWSGQYQWVDEKEEIIAFWLLTKETAPGGDWEATLIGKDIFTRTASSPEEIEANRRRIARSNP